MKNFFNMPPFYLEDIASITDTVASEIVEIKRLFGLPGYGFATRVKLGAQPNGNWDIPDWGFGYDLCSPSIAYKKSISEAFEREYSKRFEIKKLIYASELTLEELCVSPENFSLISSYERERFEESNNYKVYSKETPIHWVEGFIYERGEFVKKYLPAFLSYQHFSKIFINENFCPNLSPGLACHYAFKDAFLNGIYEVIERDAFMIFWLKKPSLNKLNPNNYEFPNIIESIDFLDEYKLSIHYYDLTTDFNIPTTLCLITNSMGYIFSSGLGCNINHILSVQKAYHEAILLSYSKLEEYKNKVNSIDTSHLFMDWWGKDEFNLTEMVGYSKSDIKQRSFFSDLEEVLFRIRENNSQTYFLNMTPEKFSDSKLCICRTFISQAQPMLYEEEIWRLNLKRIFSCRFLAQSKESTIRTVDELNFSRHPFQV